MKKHFQYGFKLYNRERYVLKVRAPHDEVEPNLKKTHHRNGIWGLEAIVM